MTGITPLSPIHTSMPLQCINSSCKVIESSRVLQTCDTRERRWKKEKILPANSIAKTILRSKCIDIFVNKARSFFSYVLFYDDFKDLCLKCLPPIV